MDEIDNIIIHSLRQIGCPIDDDVSGLSDFTPETLVTCAVKCLGLIDPSIDIPKTLPSGMAQRYSATTTLAEACVSIGFRGDIGYQTFLYSNVIEVRRVLMFLIERLPKEIEKLATPPTDKLSAIELEVAASIRLQLNSAWTPQYCKKYGITRFGSITAVQDSSNAFAPHNIHIPRVTQSNSSDIPIELKEYWLKRSPTLFQQVKRPNLCATVIQKNDTDRQSKYPEQDRFNQLIGRLNSNDGKNKSSSILLNSVQSNNQDIRNIKSVQQLKLDNVRIPNENDIIQMPEISAADALSFDIEKLKQSIESAALAKQTLTANIGRAKERRGECEQAVVELTSEKRIKERTQILLENPTVNSQKMGEVLAATEARLKNLAKQWDAHRFEMIGQLERAQNSSSSQNALSRQICDQIKATKDKTSDIAATVSAKAVEYAKLTKELEQFNKNISRNDYTSRILEIIANIRKQKTDIDRVLQDTRILQKEINNVGGQLDRQFAVTDDLLFKNAKRDDASKNAYKHLAALHANCGDLVQLIQDTGAAMKEVRDIEDQIEIEKTRNVAENLIRITEDLRIVEQEGQDVLAKLNRTTAVTTTPTTTPKANNIINHNNLP